MDSRLNVPHYSFITGAGEHNWRLDAVLVRHLPKDYSRTQLQRYIAQGQVLVNGVIVTKRHAIVHRGDRIEAAVTPLSRDITLLPEDIPLDIVYEDQHLLVVNKPAGLVTHPAVGHWSGTLVNAVLGYLQAQGSGLRAQLTIAQGSGLRAQGKCPEPRAQSPQRKASILDPASLRPGIVHRLDKDTSGLLLVAKDAATQYQLARQLQARTIHRTYLAVVRGIVQRAEGTINAPIGRHPKHRKEFTIRANGRPAVTHYRVLTQAAQSHFGPFSVLEVRLETGRTHQIRVHMAYLGHPILGDRTYGGSFVQPQIARQLLHAEQLTLVHPVLKQPMTFRAPIPDDMQPLLRAAETASSC